MDAETKQVQSTEEYEKPQVTDYGTLRELTAATSVPPKDDGFFPHTDAFS